MSSRGRLRDDDFARLLGFRDGLRRFLHWSEEQARAVGITPSQHQLLLAVRGHKALTAHDPSVSEIAEHLLLRHHSVVELVDRAVASGLVVREIDDSDQRVVRVRLTRTGEAKLVALTEAHLEELARLRPRFTSLWQHLPPAGAG